jgi:hypothetical protein
MIRFLFGNYAEEQRAAAEAVRLAAMATQAAAEALAERDETPAETERNVRRRTMTSGRDSGISAFRPGRGGVDLQSPPPGIVPFSGRAYRLD